MSAPETDGPVLVTGAAGFIGSWVVEALRARWPTRPIVSFDALTYAGDRTHLAALDGDVNHTFVLGNVNDRSAVRAALERHRPTALLHLAAESHVDRSILDPLAFVRTNIEGTAILLQEAVHLWGDRRDVRFVHVSTDEVYGPTPDGVRFDESSPYRPSSPYAASKASSDHLVRSWHHVYGLPTIVTHCTNNYGPRQFPEKLLPVVVSRALQHQPVPIYGRGTNVRDWLYVADHALGLIAALERGRPGRTYCFSAENERSNLWLVEQLMTLLDARLGRAPGQSRTLVKFVADRPAHDLRYALDATRARDELGWSPRMPYAQGLEHTVSWYVEHQTWTERMRARQAAFEATWYEGRGGEQP